MKTLILGASGYVGSNVLATLDPKKTTVINRRLLPGFKTYDINLADQLLETNHQLFKETPEVVLYLSRPTNADFIPYRTFHTNVQNLLMTWCTNPGFKGVQFASSTMVYSGSVPILKEEDKILAMPLGIYEYFKLETELFLNYLHTCLRPDAFFNIWRLPIVFGGHFDPERHSGQFLYTFYQQYREGYSWQFVNEKDVSYGTSWVYLPDLVRLLTDDSPCKPGFRIKNLASGFFTYQDLHNFFLRKLSSIGDRPIKLFKTRFEVRDEGNMPQMTLDQAFDAVALI